MRSRYTGFVAASQPFAGCCKHAKSIRVRSVGNTHLKLAIVLFALFSCVPASAQTPSASDAVALEQQGKLTEAEKDWRLVLQHNPQDAAAQASLGVVLSRQGKYAEAVPAYQKALR